MPAPVIRFRIDFGPSSSVGPGKIGLLEEIGKVHSLSQAARNQGMSYRRAWLLISSLNQSFEEPVITASTGGRGGGGAELTLFGRSLIAAYRAFEKDALSAGAKRFHAIAARAIGVTDARQGSVRQRLSRRKSRK